MPGATITDGKSHPENLDTSRVDGGFVGRFLTSAGRVVATRASAVTQHYEHTFGRPVNGVARVRGLVKHPLQELVASIRGSAERPFSATRSVRVMSIVRLHLDHCRRIWS